MIFEKKMGIVIQAFLCFMLSVLLVVHGRATDIYCLRSIKDSLEDPYNYLSSWNFNNQTEGFLCDFVGVECWYVGESRILNLKLSNMGLKGQFSRGLKNCSSLTGLDLSLNDLTGPIPSDISSLIPFVTSLDLSSNKFNGEIPANLANCSYLNTLKLDNNMLTGQIPQQLEQLPRIKSISFSNNHFSGQVPVFHTDTVSVESFANNSELCGGPFLPPCSLDKSNDFHQSFKDGLIVGFAFSVTSVIVLYMSYCAPWQQSKHKRNMAKGFGKYICFIAGGNTRIEANQIQKQQTLQLHEKPIKEKNRPFSEWLGQNIANAPSQLVDVVCAVCNGKE